MVHHLDGVANLHGELKPLFTSLVVSSFLACAANWVLSGVGGGQDGGRSEVNGNLEREQRGFRAGSIATPSRRQGAFGLAIGSRRRASPGGRARADADTDIFPRYPSLHASTRKESCGRRLLRSPLSPTAGSRIQQALAGRSQKTPLPPWDLCADTWRRRALMSGFPSLAPLYFSHTDNVGP